MYSKILIPVDGREGAWRAIRVATQASKICDGEIILLHVEEPSSELLSGSGKRSVDDLKSEDGMKRIQPVNDYLDSVKIPHRLLVKRGIVPDTIVRVAHQEGCDLIAMFTDDPKTLGEVIFGSTTQRVLKGIDIDLLSVRK